MYKLLNAFSLNMLEIVTQDCSFSPLGKGDVIEILENSQFESCIGHQNTANVLMTELGVNVSFNRNNALLKKGDKAIVAQYSGTRLEEGATSLPQGAKMVYWLVEIYED